MARRNNGSVTPQELETALLGVDDLDEDDKDKIIEISELDTHQAKGNINFQKLMETCVWKDLLGKNEVMRLCINVMQYDTKMKIQKAIR